MKYFTGAQLLHTDSISNNEIPPTEHKAYITLKAETLHIPKNNKK